MTTVSDFQKYCFSVLLVLLYSNALARLPDALQSAEEPSVCAVKFLFKNPEKAKIIFSSDFKIKSGICFFNNKGKERSSRTAENIFWQSIHFEKASLHQVKNGRKFFTENTANFTKRKKPYNKDDLEVRKKAGA